MQLTVLGSNSNGNGYLLRNDSEALLIECGVSISSIKKALNFRLDNVSAIVTHAHGDHSKSLRDLVKSGIRVYANEYTLGAMGCNGHHRVTTMVAGFSYKIGGFTVKPFEVHHDVPTLGFLIHHTECGLTLFLTDTCYTDYTFPGLNNVIVECNHDVELVRNNQPGFLRDRIYQSHMNLDTCKQLLRANDLSQVNNIVLIHLSDSNSDALRFKREVSHVTGKHVTIAEAGITIPFNKTPF